MQLFNATLALVLACYSATSAGYVTPRAASKPAHREAFTQCVSDSRWRPPPALRTEPEELADQCESALFTMLEELEFLGDEVGDWQWRFMGGSFVKFIKFRVHWSLPLRYIYKGCTIAVTVTKTWENKPLYWQLPRLPKPPQGGNAWPRMERASWVNATDKIGYVRGGCPGGMGYALVGEDWGVTVASWGTNSPFDKQLGLVTFADQAGLNVTGPLMHPFDTS